MPSINGMKMAWYVYLSCSILGGCGTLWRIETPERHLRQTTVRR